MNQGRMPNNY